MPKEILLTYEGLKKYEQELEELKTVGRRDIAEKIAVARSFGDLSENAEYDEAKNEQGKLEAKIAEYEAMLKNARVIDEGELTGDSILVGCKVRVKNMSSGKEVTYHIVGTGEADPVKNRISNESPIGKALLGDHKAGDKVEVFIAASGKTLNLEILEISK